MLRLALFVTPIALVTAIACGNSDSGDSGSTDTAGSSNAAGAPDNNQGGGETTAGTTSTGGSSNNNGGSTTTQGGTSNPNGGAPTEPMGGASTGVGGSPDIVGGAGGATAANCPDIFGTYTIKTIAGMCGDLNKAAPEAIQGNDVTCTAHFVSQPAKGAPGVNGATTVNAMGDFKAAKLMFGTAQRTDCSGTYNAVTGAMTVKCGALKDACTALLVKQ